MPRRALVIGGSMSGLLAAIMLQRRGWTVDVFERVESELAGRGAGIVAQTELIARLKALELETNDLGILTKTRKLLDINGHIILTVECPQVLTAWERVYRVLRDAFPAQHYHRGRGLKSFEQNKAGVLAHLTDGTPRKRMFWSALTACVPRCAANACPTLLRFMPATVRGGRSCPRARIPPDIHRELFESMAFCLPPGEQCLFYPVAGPNDDLRAGHRRSNVVWYRPADEHRTPPAPHRRQRRHPFGLNSAAAHSP